MSYQMNYFPTGAHSVYFNIAYDSCLVAAPQMPIAGFPAELNHSSELTEQKEESKLHKSRVYRKIYNNGACPYGSVPNKKSLYWKTKICHKWLSTGDCPYGIQCCYAHGDAELRKPTRDYDALVKKQVAAAPSKSVAPNLAEDMLSKAKNEPGKPACLLESHNKIRALGLKKIDRIYGDWI